MSARRELTEIRPKEISEGQRNSTLTSFAGSMRNRGMSKEAIEVALLTENELRCDPPLPQEDVKTIAQSIGRYPPYCAEYGELILLNLADVQREDVQWVWQGRIPRGKLTLFDGDPGTGKTCVSLAIATAVTRGLALPGDDCGLNGTVLILTAEDGLGDTVKPRLEDMGADTSKVI